MTVDKQTTASFLVLAPALAHTAPAVIQRLKEHGLSVEQVLTLDLHRTQTEQLLFAVTEHLRRKPVELRVEEVRARKHGLATTRLFGSEQFATEASVPSLEAVEEFSTSALSCIVVSSIDPRVNVVETLNALVGPEDRKDAVARKSCLRAMYDAPDHARVWRIVAPLEAASAVRGLGLVRRFHAEATAPAGSQHPRPHSSADAGGGASRFGDSVSSLSSTRNSAGVLGREGGLLATLTLAGPFPPGATQGKEVAVDVDQLLSFVFPPGEQWPNSTGRLILAAMYGPLTAEGKLNGGRRSGRPLTDSEVEAMISEVERDDLLAVYTAGGVTGDVDTLLADIRAASRKLPRMSKNQAIAMLADLPRDSSDRVSFHDFQRRVVRARMERVRELGNMFPDVIARRDPDVARLLISQAPKPYGKGTLQRRLADEGSLGATIAAGGNAARAAAQGLGSFRALMAAKETHRRTMLLAGSGQSGTGDLGGTGGGKSVSFGESYGVGEREEMATARPLPRAAGAGPASGRAHSVGPTLGLGTGAGALFPSARQFDRAAPRRHAAVHPAAGFSGGLDTRKKMSDVERARTMEGLLHKNLTLVSSVEDAGDVGKAIAAKASSLILRPDLPSAKDGFNRFAPLRLHQPNPSRVPGGLTRSDMQATRIDDA